MSKSWDSGILKKLKALTGKGLSTAEIGKKLGISKNAVVGKLHRLGWNSKAAENASKKIDAKGAKTAKAPAKTVKTTKTSVAKAKAVTTKTVKPAKKTIVKNNVEKVVKNKKAIVKDVKTIKPSKSVGVAKKAKETAKKVVTKNDKNEKTVVVELKKTKTSSTSGKKNLSVHQRMIQHSLEMMDLKPGQCRWPIGDPDSENFHFCGRQVFVGKPYCYEHCKQAYQFTAPKKK